MKAPEHRRMDTLKLKEIMLKDKRNFLWKIIYFHSKDLNR